MSQYGYVPLENAVLLQETYNISTTATWQFDKNDIMYGGVEDLEFTEAKKNEIASLGGDWFENAQSFLQRLNE